MLWKQRSGENEMIAQVSYLNVRKRGRRMTMREVIVRTSLTRTTTVIAVIVQEMKK
jgi:hypothetical protein